jgi:predicted dehydrogenase
MNVAVVGCGAAGTQHTAAVSRSRGVLVGVCDDIPARAHSLAVQVDAPVRPLADLINDAAVDVIAVCTPPATHLSIATQVLQSGKAAVVEKPVAIAATDVDRLAATATRVAQPLAVMLQHRARLPAVALEHHWSSGTSATIEVFRRRPVRHYASMSWRGKPEIAGGGFFAHLAIHYVDMACQLLGRPRSIHALVEDGDAPGIDRRLTACVYMMSGAMLSIHASSAPETRQERLLLLDGGCELLVTNSETRYRDGEHTLTEPAPATDALRAAVYREVYEARRAARPVRRFGVDTSVGAVDLIERFRAQRFRAQP